jgi:hypothetical protein
VLPPVSHVLSVEMIRDGGSLAAGFRGSDGSECWLLFPVRTESVDADHSRIAGWDTPEIHERSTGLKSQVSWQHAATFIGQLASHVHDPQQIAILGAMRDVAGAVGSITPSVKAVYPSVGELRRAFYPTNQAG